VASPRFSLRWQLALSALATGLLFAALGFAGAAPLLVRAAERGRAEGLVTLLAALSVLAGVILSLVIYSLLVRLVARPADRLLDATERIGTQAGEGPLLSEEGPVFGRLGTAFDRMSKRLRAEQDRTRAQLDELRRINRELAEARDAMVRQEKLATVGRLSAGVAHEIGNPLAALLGYLEILKAMPEAGPLAGYLERMEREGKRIDRIVRDLLDFARPSRAAAPHPVELAPLLEQTLRLVRGQRRFRDVAIEAAVATGVPPALADEHHLQQVLVNLLVNAADAMGGAGRIEIAAAAEGDAIVLTVRDHGPGIAPADLPRLFDPFFTTKDPGAGTGLGLSICHALVESFGGTIAAGNHPDGGARFTLRLPVVEVAEEESA